MFNAKNILTEAFTSSLDNLSYFYDQLASMSNNERTSFVKQVNKEILDIERKIVSPETKNALTTLLRYQYATRFAFDCHSFDEHGEQDRQPREYFIKKICGNDWNNENPLRRMLYERPTESEFVIEVGIEIEKKDFYRKVELSTDQLYGIILPEESETFDSWLNKSRLLEKDWKWKYSNNIERWKNKLLTPKNKIRTAEKCWQMHLEGSLECILFIKNMYPSLIRDYFWLISLKESQLNINVMKYSIDKANTAITEGVQLKHLLLEEAVENEKLYEKVVFGL